MSTLHPITPGRQRRGSVRRRTRVAGTLLVVAILTALVLVIVFAHASGRSPNPRHRTARV